MQGGSSFIWAGIMTAKESLYMRYRWVLDNGLDINVVKDAWLKGKEDFCVTQNHDYGVPSKNNVPVRKGFSVKGVSLPIICPMCNADIEHKLHVFFYCLFSTSCWRYDMNMVEYAPEWLLKKLSAAGHAEIL